MTISLLLLVNTLGLLIILFLYRYLSNKNNDDDGLDDIREFDKKLLEKDPKAWAELHKDLGPVPQKHK